MNAKEGILYSLREMEQYLLLMQQEGLIAEEHVEYFIEEFGEIEDLVHQLDGAE